MQQCCCHLSNGEWPLLSIRMKWKALGFNFVKMHMDVFLHLWVGALLSLMKLCILLVLKQYCYIIQSPCVFKAAGKRIAVKPNAKLSCCSQWLRRQKGLGSKCQPSVCRLYDLSYFWSKLDACACKDVWVGTYVPRRAQLKEVGVSPSGLLQTSPREEGVRSIFSPIFHSERCWCSFLFSPGSSLLTAKTPTVMHQMSTRRHLTDPPHLLGHHPNCSCPSSSCSFLVVGKLTPILLVGWADNMGSSMPWTSLGGPHAKTKFFFLPDFSVFLFSCLPTRWRHFCWAKQAGTEMLPAASQSPCGYEHEVRWSSFNVAPYGLPHMVELKNYDWVYSWKTSCVHRL